MERNSNYKALSLCEILGYIINIDVGIPSAIRGDIAVLERWACRVFSGCGLLTRSKSQFQPLVDPSLGWCVITLCFVCNYIGSTSLEFLS